MDGSLVRKALNYYPSPMQVDQYVERLWERATKMKMTAEITQNDGRTVAYSSNYNIQGSRYVKFTVDGHVFWGYWQTPKSTPAPLLVTLPGYSARISTGCEMSIEGYAVLFVSPLGYTTPNGNDESLKIRGGWPVLPYTSIGMPDHDYSMWLNHVMLATKWAMSQKEVIDNRVSFFGTSQGGGGSLLLASIFKDAGARCVAADLPFLTNFPLANFADGAYSLARIPVDEKMIDEATMWTNLGYIDTLSHAHRLIMPVLLTAGGADVVCPPNTIQSLYDKLPNTKSIVYLHKAEHDTTQEAIYLTRAWMRMFA